MGRYLACGVAREIVVYKRKYASNDFKFLDSIEEIKNDMSNFINLDLYNIEDAKEEDECLVLNIKEDEFNKNINEFIEELNLLVPCKSHLFDKNEDNKNTLELKYLEENSKELEKIGYKEGYYLICNGEESVADTSDCPFYSTEKYYLINNRNIEDNIDLDISYIVLWFDYNKMDSENETQLIEVVNKLKKDYFKNPLGSSLMFYITG